MSETLTEEPPIGSTIELAGEDNLQAGWRYYRTDLGWVRVWSDGCIDATHPLDWRFAGYCVLVDGPWYPDFDHFEHRGSSHVGGIHRPKEKP